MSNPNKKMEQTAPVQAWIERIEFSGGETVHLSKNDIVLIVGANNSGKSKTLEELHLLNSCSPNDAARALSSNYVVKGVELGKRGTSAEFATYLENNGTLKNHHYLFRGARIHSNHIIQFDKPRLHAISQGFQLKLDASERTNSVHTQSSIRIDQDATSAQHFLYNNTGLMDYVSKLFQAAFGQELFFNFRGGSEIPIHVGEKPICEPDEQYVHDSYVSKVTRFPNIDEQGDGMKSYTGILFQTVVFPRDIIFIDEPEAFLHPPQMRRLGKTLAEESNGQLIVATHSTDILRGFLQGESNRVRVIRLERIGDKNHATELSAESIKELWEHPQIRYSTALDAIFHEQAVICEDDSDCRLYSAMANHLESKNDTSRWKDTHYVPTGGKHAAARVAAALTALNVPVKMIFDFDLLSDKNSVRKTYESVGGIWSDIAMHWQRVDAAVRDGVKSKTHEEIREEIVELLSKDDQPLPKSHIKELLRQDKPWSFVKRNGSLAIPNGEATKEYLALRDSMQQSGVFWVEKGEVEQFCPSIGSHGSKFVSQLLESRSLDDPELEDLRNFVRDVLTS